MSLLLNMLSRLVITFLPGSKRLLISWLQSPSVVILEPRITADGDCSHEIKRRLLPGRKVMTKLVQFSSVIQSCPTPCDPMNCSTPGLLVHHQLPEFTQTHVHWVGDAIQPSHPLLSPSPPAPNPSQHQSFPMSQHITWSGQSIGVSASISVLPRLISSRMDWLDLLAVQGTLKSLLQHHRSKASILRHSASSQSNYNMHTWPLEKL